MPAPNASFEFNMASGAYRAKLTEQDRGVFDQMQQERVRSAEREKADYAQNRGLYTDQEEKHLIQHYRKNLNMPPPPGVLPPRMPSGPEIRQKAADNVRHGHAMRLAKIDKEGNEREREFIKTALDFKPPPPPPPGDGRLEPSRGRGGPKR